MERRALTVAGLGLLALGAWWVARAGTRPTSPQTRTTEASPRSPGTDATVAPREPVSDAADAGAALSTPCAHHWLALPVGTELRYLMSVSVGEDTQSGDYRLRLLGAHVEGHERVESWLGTIAFDGAVEPVESRFTRRCSDTAGAQEPWVAVDLAGLSELAYQGWRWPAELREGTTFGGELRRTLMGQTLTMQRQHRVLGVEEVSTPAGDFDAWHVEVTDTDTAHGGSPGRMGELWMMPGVGLVRLLQPSEFGTLRIELGELVAPVGSPP